MNQVMGSPGAISTERHRRLRRLSEYLAEKID